MTIKLRYVLGGTRSSLKISAVERCMQNHVPETQRVDLKDILPTKTRQPQPWESAARQHLDARFAETVIPESHTSDPHLFVLCIENVIHHETGEDICYSALYHYVSKDCVATGRSTTTNPTVPENIWHKMKAMEDYSNPIGMSVTAGELIAAAAHGQISADNWFDRASQIKEAVLDLFEPASNCQQIASKFAASVVFVMPDVPVAGISFESWNAVYKELFIRFLLCRWSAAVCRSAGADVVVGLDSRGYPLAALIGMAANIPMLMMQKASSKTPAEKGFILSDAYGTEYSGDNRMAANREHFTNSPLRVLLVDDLLATGQTMITAAQLTVAADPNKVVVGAVVLRDLQLKGAEPLPFPVYALF
jgi:adenine phosphoribosyltransferase